MGAQGGGNAPLGGMMNQVGGPFSGMAFGLLDKIDPMHTGRQLGVVAGPQFPTSDVQPGEAPPVDAPIPAEQARTAFLRAFGIS